MCRSRKYEAHVVGWCSDTDAMIGTCFVAYVGSSSERDLDDQEVFP